ncbi:hypothetical protein ASG17_06185 [Brevundimonas sp. Leaf363]|uniref:SPFH domain-containing protein n=1 Tax=Brevundimonas sp. Leaf363 TaxID=1736353 RepID=UPI00070083D5|nr:SPFH domain-containing protein [Brevundimonas sp. Leaf363]KQS55653.1 hypothetical protein ASG17_06185 [Brevundimonas sp. Leaf363]
MSASVWIACLVALVVAALATCSVFKAVRISRWEVGALYRDGGFVRMLPPGRYTLLRHNNQQVVRILAGLNYWPVGPIDVVTQDGLPIRLSATAVYTISDPEASLGVTIPSLLQLAVSQALLKLASTRDLEALQGRDEAIDEALKALVGTTNAALTIERVALGSIVLPPELRRMTTEVERARLEGLAQLERARGEQAALRSLANAARMLKDNPELMKLRLLQSIGSGKGATLVLGEAALSPGVET